LNKTYPSVDAYYKHVSQKSNQKDHTGFLSARKEWVNQHNQAGPDRKRLLSKTELLEAKKKLNFQKRTGGKFLKPKKQFVERDSWDPKLHGGEYDPSKEVAENLFGKEVRGVWILKGRKGVYDFEEFQEAAMEETENIHDSRDAPFSEVALARKKKAALDQFTQGSQAREKNAVEHVGQELSMEALVATLQGSGPSASSSACAVASGQVESEPDSESSCSGENKSSEEEEEAENIFGPCKKKPPQSGQGGVAPKPKPTPSNKAAKQVKSSAPRPAEAAVAPKPDRRSGSAREAKGPQRQDTQDSGSSTFLADGRAQRALRNLLEKKNELKSKLDEIRMDDSNPEPDAHSQAAFKQSCADRVATLKSLGRQARDYFRRMDKSSNKEFFEDGIHALQEVETKSVALQNLLSSVSAPGSLPDAIVKAYDDAAAVIPSMGTCFQLRYALAKASQCCLYSEYDKFCSQFLLECDNMKNISQAIGKAKLEECVVAEIESRVLLNLRAIKPVDVQALAAGKGDVSSFTEAESILKAVCRTQREHGDSFLGHSLGHACLVAAGLVSSGDLSATREALDDLNEEEETDDISGIKQFFLSHTVGQSLVDMATSRVSSGETEADAMEDLKKFEYELQPLASLAGKKVRGVKLITELLQPIQDLLKQCEKRVSALKVGKAAAKATKEEAMEAKLSNKAYERLHVLLAGHEKAFGAAARTLLEAELKANLSQNVRLGC